MRHEGPVQGNSKRLSKRIASLLACVAVSTVLAAQQPLPPNILLIVADDLGYGDLGAYGGRVIATPHIDALARGGVRLRAGYVSHPVCGPSRAGLITGRYQQRHGYEFNPAGRDVDAGLALTEQTMADRLRAAGYRTGMVGKWHLGQRRDLHPMSRGFDEYFGVLEGGSQYFDGPPPNAVFAALGTEEISPSRGNAVWRGFEAVKEKEYLTDAFTREALDFLDRQSKPDSQSGNGTPPPFFLYLAYTAPHTPLEATAEYAAPYAHLEDDRQRVYSAMVAAIDQGVGQLVDRLRELEQLENTLIVFLSDNGCISYGRGACSNAPLRGFKRYHHEGGVRVPFMLHWPAGLPRGRVFDEPVTSLDLTPTFLAAAGSASAANLAGLDGVDLLPYLRGERDEAPHERLFWRAGPTLAVREGRWKWIRLARSDRDLSEIDNPGHTLSLQDWSDPGLGSLTLLYDLEADPGEQENLAGEHPDIVKRLEAAAGEWGKGLGQPMWPPRRSTLAEIDGVVVQLLY